MKISKAAVFAVSFFAILGSASALAQSSAPHSREILTEMKNVQWNWKKRAEKVERFNRTLSAAQTAQRSAHPDETKCVRTAYLAKALKGTVIGSADQF